MANKSSTRKDKHRKRVAVLLKIGVLGAFIIFIGDLLMGWGIRDESQMGIERMVSQYLAVSDSRMLCSAILGLIGVPLAVLGHYGIYKLLKPYSRKYAKMYLIGDFGFLALAGAGVHLSSIESVYFYKYMTAADPNIALDNSLKFVSCFVMPLYVLLLPCMIIMVYAHARVVLKNFSPYPRRLLVFSMLVGVVLMSLIGFLGNHPAANALMVGAFSFGNIWTLAGHLHMVTKANMYSSSESESATKVS